MPKVFRILAPAKLNLCLQVYARRSDGFHDLTSVFQAVSLYDEILVSVNELENSFSLTVNTENGDVIALPAKNTLSETLRVFRQKTGCSQGLSVKLIKRIPMGAGFGGGSSDAASFLRLLDFVFDTKLSEQDLLEIVAQVGSDVPFFLYAGTAIVAGRGEIVKPLKGFRANFDAELKNFFVIIWPNVACSTPNAFKWLDEYRDNVQNRDKEKSFSVLSEEQMIERLTQKPCDWNFENSFEEPVKENIESVGMALSDLKSVNAVSACLTGSGSGVFGIFNSQQDAESAFNKLKSRWAFCWVVQTVSNLPSIEEV